MKKFLIIVGVVLVFYFIISHPIQAADAVQGLLSWLKDGAEAIITFLRNLFA